MEANPEVSMRGGGMVGDWYVLRTCTFVFTCVSVSIYIADDINSIVSRLSALSNVARVSVTVAARYPKVSSCNQPS
jgi:hypothetical protein